MSLDAATSVAALAAAATDLTRLLPGRIIEPTLSGALVTADATGIRLAGTDRERAVLLEVSGVVHAEGRALVRARPFAETLRAIDEPEIRVSVEGSRLAIRTPRGRFALPLLDADAHPGVPVAPPVAGSIRAEALITALTPVAGAASKEDALPVFTGVRLHRRDDQLEMLASDRYRMAVATVPWRPAAPDAALDVLVPAALLTEIARQAPKTGEITLHVDADRMALSWPGASIGSALLAAPFPDQAAQRLLAADFDATAGVEADVLAGAIRRAAPYSGPWGVVDLRLTDGEIRVTGRDPQAGESDEAVKAAVAGDHLTQRYQARYLLDGLTAFPRRTVELRFQHGIQATVLTAEPAPGGPLLRYVVMPMRPPAGPDTRP